MDIGDKVIHPRYGVGIIGAIEERIQDGETRSYYVIPKPSICSTIFVPVDAADELGLRPLASPDLLKEAVRILCGEDESDCASGLRNLEWNDPLALAGAIRKVAVEPKSRYPKVSEQHQLKRAKKLLAEELAEVLGLTDENIVSLIEKPEASVANPVAILA
jgi:CarD family transcriptional regulator